MCISFKIGYKDANLGRVDAIGHKHPNFSNSCRFDAWPIRFSSCN